MCIRDRLRAQSDVDQDCLVGTAGGGGGLPRAWFPLVVGRVAGVEQRGSWLLLSLEEGRAVEEGIGVFPGKRLVRSLRIAVSSPTEGGPEGGWGCLLYTSDAADDM
eukprot:8301992-Prorocentrum_lima.AAC.1